MALVATLPAEFPAPLVLAQHLDPTRPSHLEEILGRHSPLPVRTVSEQAHLEPGVIFVVPANAHVEITNSTLSLRPDAEGRSKPSVDLLFSSAAAAYGEQLIAVVLTGTGSDGAAGAAAVKEAGGTVIIQDPLTSAYPGMALAVAPTAVDIAAPLERIGALLVDLLTGRGVPAAADEQQALERFLEELRQRHGLDFTQYKPATILRRLQRRILATGSKTLDSYRAYLANHPQEAQMLTNSLLIKVTEFFRDPDLFRALQEVVVPELIAYARSHEQTIRCWSAGCATGEEAYSLAILLAEALGEELDAFHVRLFATDADPDAVAFARQGSYPERALAKLPEDLVARYFTHEQDRFVVAKRLRTMTVFGQHDLTQRAPFPRMDLVLCRNVLIYFASELQQRTLRLFTYALRDGGTLVLGKSESPGSLAPYFQQQHKRLKIYRRQGERLLLPPATFAPPPATLHARWSPPFPPLSASERRPAAAVSGDEPTPEAVLQTLPVGVVVVDRHYDIASINLAARRLLAIHRPAQGEDLLHLVPSSLALPLRAAIDRALHEGEASAPAEVALDPLTPGGTPTLQVDVYPQRNDQTPGAGRRVVVVVQEITRYVEERRALQQQVQTLSDDLAHAQQEASTLEVMNRRLEERNRHLLQTNEELTSTNEDLHASNQEVLLGAEEAQAAVEEVETLNEELQASNEELETLNEELQATIEELNTTNEDLAVRSQELQQLNQTREYERARLEAILMSMGDALLVVNRAGVTLLTNAAYARMFGHADAAFEARDAEGKPLPAEATPQQRARHGEAFTLEFTGSEQAGERRYYEATGQPIAQEDLGGVVVIRDITERSLHRLQDQFMALAGHELRSPLTVLQGNLQRLLQALPADADENGTARGYAEKAYTGAKRLARLVEELLDATRLQYGTYALQREPVDLTQLVAETIEALQATTPRPRIQFDAPTEPVVVAGDAGRLEQVLLNLLTNALTYAATAERIEVRLGRVEDGALLQVQDDGPGIPATALPHLFTRFYRGPLQAHNVGGGLGLGLAITRDLVLAHGGHITVESVVGQGTTFSVWLPVLPKTEEPEQTGDASRTG